VYKLLLCINSFSESNNSNNQEQNPVKKNIIKCILDHPSRLKIKEEDVMKSVLAFSFV